jgi:hypothetical protein
MRSFINSSIYSEYSLEASNSNNNSTIPANKRKMRKGNSVHKYNLVEVLPIRTERGFIDYYDFIKQRIIKYKKYKRRYFKPLTLESFRKALEDSKVQMDNVSVHTDDNFILYKYGEKPLIILNIENGRFYTPRTIWEAYNHALICHQAYIITDILRSKRLSSAYRDRSKFYNPHIKLQKIYDTPSKVK